MGNSGSRKAAARLRRQRVRVKTAAARSLLAADAEPRFVADVMLGRLAKWLRIAGFDVLYSNRFTDDELVELSRREQRVLLSRDVRLLLRRAVELPVYVESDRLPAQLAQVLRATGRIPGVLTRCLRCNAHLDDVERERVRAAVPEFVFATQVRFKLCAACGRIYWPGTHRDAVLRTLGALLPGMAP